MSFLRVPDLYVYTFCPLPFNICLFTHQPSLPYIVQDPTYMIRAIPTTSNDRIYCKILAHNAVHAAFAGYTGLTVGLVNTHYVYLPIPVVISAPRKVINVIRSSKSQIPLLHSPSLSFLQPLNDPKYKLPYRWIPGARHGTGCGPQ